MTEDLLRDLAELPATSRHVAAGDLRLHALDYGGDAAVAAVIVPGITSPAITWDFVASRLRPSVRPVVLDLRGRGLSDAPSQGYAIADHVADLRAVVEALDLDRPVLVGHSLGARIAAAAIADDPDLARGAVLVDPPVDGPYPTTLASFVEQLREAAAGCTADDVARHYPHWPRRERELRARWLRTCSPVAVAEAHRGFERDSFLPTWMRLTSRATLVHGAESAVLAGDAIARLAAANPAPAIVGIPRAGHMVAWDNPTDFLAVLQHLLQVAETDVPMVERTL